MNLNLTSFFIIVVIIIMARNRAERGKGRKGGEFFGEPAEHLV